MAQPVDLSGLVDSLRDLSRTWARSSKEVLPPAFATPEPAAWLSYEQTFKVMADANGWMPRRDAQGVLQPVSSDKDLRARQLLFAAMKGEASLAVAHLEVTSYSTLSDLLAALKDVFVPAARGFKTRSDFRTCSQSSGESLLQWHTRCRALYRQAYPTGDIEKGEELLHRFSEGLASPQMAFHLQATPDVDTWTYSKFLKMAQQFEAASERFARPGASAGINAIGQTAGRNNRNGNTGRQKDEMLNVTSATKGVMVKVPSFSWIAKYANATWDGPTCFHCRIPGHRLGECAGYTAARQKLSDSGSGQRGGRGGGRRGRGGGRGRGRGGYGVYSMEGQQDEPELHRVELHEDDQPLFPEGN